MDVPDGVIVNPVKPAIVETTGLNQLKNANGRSINVDEKVHVYVSESTTS